MADVWKRAAERAVTYGAAGATAGGLLGGGIFSVPMAVVLGAGGALAGAVSGALSASEENDQLEKAKREAEQTITDASSELATATEENREYLSEVIGRARGNLYQITQRQRQLAEEISQKQEALARETAGIQQRSLNEQQGALDTAQLERLKAIDARSGLGLAGYEALRGALTEQGTAEEGGLTAQEGFLTKIAQLQQQGIAAREALTADEEAAARRITAPGGLLERQRQSNALAQARAMQRARTGGPAARAAIMGQFATQGAELGMQAQRDIMAAQDRARQARAGLLGERTSASVAQQQGLSGVAGQRAALLSRLAGARGDVTFRQKEFEGGLAGERGGIQAARQQQYAEFLNKVYGVDVERAKQLAQAQMERAKQLGQADIDYTQGLGKIDQSEFEAATGMRSKLGDIYSQERRDVGDVRMATRGRALELDQQESARNAGLLQSVIPLFGSLAPSPTAAASAGNTYDKAGQAVNTRRRLTQPAGPAGYGGLG